jgi:hypothetical protein
VHSKHKTKDIKTFYIYNIGKTLVKCGWNYRVIYLHQTPSHLALAHPREMIDKIKLKITMTNLLISHQCPRIYALESIVIKPGSAWRVVPVRVCQKTGRCNDLAKPGQPMTRANSDETRCFCFFKIWFFSYTPLFSYFLSHVCGVAAIVHPQGKCKWFIWQMWETRNSCLLSVKWNGSRRLIFWSLGTLTGLRDRVRRLVA